MKRLFSKNKHHHSGSLSTVCLSFFTAVLPGGSQRLFQKLLDFDEVCFECAVVEEKRGVGAWGEVFELCWLPEGAGEGWKMRKQNSYA